jgi:hypothetical protein
VGNKSKVKKQTEREKRAILSALDDDVTRVQVVDLKGKTRWRVPAEVEDGDTVQLKSSGQPSVMRAKPGRNCAPSIKPVSPNAKELMDRRQEAIGTSPLVKTVKADPDSVEVLEHIMAKIAEEAESMAFERKEAERKAEPTSTISMRAVNAYRGIADIWLKRKDQTVAEWDIDFGSPKFGVLMKFILQTVHDAMSHAGARPELIETTFARVSERLDEASWVNEARAKMKHS